MKTNICPLCVVVSGLWLTMTFGVAWGILSLDTLLVPISLLMGGTIVGIGYYGEKRCWWAASHPLLWKSLIIVIGMPLAYMFVSNLSKGLVVIVLFVLVLIAHFLFKSPARNFGGAESIKKIEKQMEDCC